MPGNKQNITAIIYDKKNKILAVGKNSYVQTHPVMAAAAKAVGQPDRIFLHAEVAALVKVRDWTKAYRIVITRFTRDGKPALSAPCKCCQYVIRQTGIKIVSHT